jgi:hypothetical protein
MPLGVLALCAGLAWIVWARVLRARRRHSRGISADGGGANDASVGEKRAENPETAKSGSSPTEPRFERDTSSTTKTEAAWTPSTATTAARTPAAAPSPPAATAPPGLTAAELDAILATRPNTLVSPDYAPAPGGRSALYISPPDGSGAWTDSPHELASTSSPATSGTLPQVHRPGPHELSPTVGQSNVKYAFMRHD